MADDGKIVCEDCTFWHNHHCENFSSKWMGMVTTKNQNCGFFNTKPKKKEEKKKENKDSSSKKEEK